jgi:hypothetical protein
LDGKSSTENQTALIVRWGQEAIINYLLIDQFKSELEGISTEDNSPLAEELDGFVREQIMEDLSSFSADTYRKLI